MKKKLLFDHTASSAKLFAVLCFILPFLWPFIPYALNAVSEFKITKKDVYLKKASGYCRKIPIDKIAMVTKTFWFGKFSIHTAAGSISVWGFKERHIVFDLIFDLITPTDAEPCCRDAEAPKQEGKEPRPHTNSVANATYINDPSAKLPQVICPNCGTQHDFDYPKCPNCKHSYRKRG